MIVFLYINSRHGSFPFYNSTDSLLIFHIFPFHWCFRNVILNMSHSVKQLDKCLLSTMLTNFTSLVQKDYQRGQMWLFNVSCSYLYQNCLHTVEAHNIGTKIARIIAFIFSFSNPVYFNSLIQSVVFNKTDKSHVYVSL